MRCAWAALVTAACAAAQNEAVAALVAKYKKSAGGSPAATAPARQPEAAPRGVSEGSKTAFSKVTAVQALPRQKLW